MGKVLLPVTPAITESSQVIPARYGPVYQGSSYGALTINVPVYYLTPYSQLYSVAGGQLAEQKIRELSAAFIDPQEERGTEYPLTFDDLPGYTFYAHITQISDPEPLNDGVSDWSSTITFVCSDPRGFLEQQDWDVADASTTAVLPVKGNTPVGAIIVATFNKDVKTFTVLKDTGEQSTEFIQLGGDADVDSGSDGTSSDDKTRMLVHDPCTTLSTWTAIKENANPVSTINLDIDGAMASTDASLRVAKNSDGTYNFGKVNTHEQWYGPGELHQALPYSPKNWKLSVRLHHSKYSGAHNYRAMAKVEVYILDTKQRTCGRIGLKDVKGGGYPQAYVQLGSNFADGTEGVDYKNLYYGSAMSLAHSSNHETVAVKYKKATKYLDNNQMVDAFSDFFGQFSIVKQYVKQADGTTAINWGYAIDQWDPKTATYMDSGVHFGKDRVTFVDTDCKFDFDLGSIAFFTAKHDITEDKAKVAYKNVFQTITDYKVEELLDAPAPAKTTGATTTGGSGTASSNGIPPAPGSTPEGYSIEAKGTFKFNANVNVRNSPDTSGSVAATYAAGQSVYYDRKVFQNGYYWLSYISYSGGRRYAAYYDTAGKAIYGTDSNPVNPVKPDTAASSGDSTTIPDQSATGNSDLSDFDQQVFHAGDELHINCDTGHVFLNNEPADYLITPDSTFFMLDGGKDNTLAFDPSSPDVDISVSVRPAIQ
jgi:hypothetical protein